MYYQNYEDYMRSVLGYPIETYSNTYDPYLQVGMPMLAYETMPVNSSPARPDDEMLELYPEIYRIVHPMICKICDTNTRPITRELIDQMTEEIYTNLEMEPEADRVINVRVNTSAPAQKTEKSGRTNGVVASGSGVTIQNRDTKVKDERIGERVGNKEVKESKEAERETRRPRPGNRILQDLIRILILNRLLGGRNPSRPPHHPRPPMPPRPPMRPPFPRNDEFYEYGTFL